MEKCTKSNQSNENKEDKFGWAKEMREKKA